ncbi:MAG: hypothetical protein V1776_03310 [Candidatus Diapherotrites archaeon]
MLKRNNFFYLLGSLTLIALVMVPMVLAGFNRVVPGIPTTVTDNNQSYSAVIVAVGDTNASLCVDSDDGFNPLLMGDLNVTFTDANMTKANKFDYCADANTLVEFACGADISGPFISDLNVYAFTYNCGDQNKVCSFGKCV